MAATWVRLMVRPAPTLHASLPCMQASCASSPRSSAVCPLHAVSLACSASLPHLQDLQLASTSMLPSHGKQLLHALLAGAAGSLQRLDLRDGSLGSGLEALVGATQLTRLDLSGAPASAGRAQACLSARPRAQCQPPSRNPPPTGPRHRIALSLPPSYPAGTALADGQLAHLALAPLRWASFARTAVGDDIGTAGMAYMTALTRLDLRCGHAALPAFPLAGVMHPGMQPACTSRLLRAALQTSAACSQTRAGDACWPALAQLPQLEWLDASVSCLALSSLPEGGARRPWLHMLKSSQLHNLRAAQ